MSSPSRSTSPSPPSPSPLPQIIWQAIEGTSLADINAENVSVFRSGPKVNLREVADVYGYLFKGSLEDPFGEEARLFSSISFAIAPEICYQGFNPRQLFFHLLENFYAGDRNSLIQDIQFISLIYLTRGTKINKIAASLKSTARIKFTRIVNKMRIQQSIKGEGATIARVGSIFPHLTVVALANDTNNILQTPVSRGQTCLPKEMLTNAYPPCIPICRATIKLLTCAGLYAIMMDKIINPGKPTPLEEVMKYVIIQYRSDWVPNDARLQLAFKLGHIAKDGSATDTINNALSQEEFDHVAPNVFNYMKTHAPITGVVEDMLVDPKLGRLHVQS